jgi:hypothetical protein
MRFLIGAVALATLLSLPAFAQDQPPRPPKRWEKTDLQRREEADVEKAYNAAIKQSGPAVQQGNSDPWAGVRETTPKAKPDKKSTAR